MISPTQLLGEMDQAGVDRALLIPPTWDGGRSDVVLRAASETPDRFRVVLRVPPDDPAVGLPLLGQCVEDPLVVGARVLFLRELTGTAADGTTDWLWSAAESSSLPLMVFAPGQYDDLQRVARRHPDLRIAICHLGMDTSLRDDDMVKEVGPLLRLATAPNIAVKASSLPNYVTDPFPFQRLHEPIRRIVEVFGAERVFFGSDLSRLTCTYRELVEFFIHHLPLISPGQLEWIMGRGVAEWFRWPLPETQPQPEVRV